MEGNFGSHDHDEQMELPPGFRFHPTDEELVCFYLYPKVFDASFVSRAIGEVDLNKVEPWDLPLREKTGEKERYFFCVRDRKYPTGLRTNRATEMGYWKATGKDREIYKAKTLVGMKKTLVFYKGRAPKGEKTNWIMHEFRLEDKLSINNLPNSTKGEWVISKVFEKICGGKKIQMSGASITNQDYYEDEFVSLNLPPLMDISRVERGTFSESVQEHKPRNDAKSFHEPTTIMPTTTENIFWFQNTCFLPTQMVPNIEYLQHHDPSILSLLIENDRRSNIRQNLKSKLMNDQDYTMNIAGVVDLHCLGNA